MRDITQNEMNVLLTLFKDFDTGYNANSLSKKIGLTSMGALKILKNLEKEGLLKSTQLGKAVFYKLNFSKYTKAYLNFLLQKEAEQSLPRIKRWVKELRRFQKTANIGVLFGSVLKKETFKDIDLLLVLEQSQIRDVNKLVAELNKVNIKKLHLVKQAKKDLESNLKKKDKVILSIVKNGIVLFGYDELIGVIENVSL